MTRLSGLALTFAFALLAFPLAAQQTTAPPAGGDVPTLQGGDVLRVAIWREPDLSGDFMVDESGMVTLPLLGQRRVAGIPVQRLRDELVRDYGAQLRNNSISITPLRRLSVLGEVNKPGVYPVDLTVTLSEAIAMAGGISPIGDPRRIRVVRSDGRVVNDRISAETQLAQTGVRSGDQVVVGRRGWFDRNSATVLTSAISLIATAVSTIIIVSSRQQ